MNHVTHTYPLVVFAFRMSHCRQCLALMQAGKGSATLSMAYAAAKFAESCLKALQGEPGVIECAYVSSHLTDLPFFASPLRLDQNGIAVSLLSYCIGHDA